MEFLVRGITEFDEPGVFVAFEETDRGPDGRTSRRWASISRKLEADGQLVLDHVSWSRGEMEETGDWDLDGLFLRLGCGDRRGRRQASCDRHDRDAVRSVLEHGDPALPSSRRLFGWLKERGVTAVITGERGDGTLTRHGIEEYVSDCVIVLDHRVTEQTSTRRLRILKYRGSLHGTNEYPFLIGESGVSVLPITSLGLQTHGVRGSGCRPACPVSTRCSATAASTRGAPSSSAARPARARSTLAAQFCDATCAAASGRCTSPSRSREAEIIRNMSSVGIDLRQWVDAGLLQFQCFRPSLLGLEAHLFAVQKFVGRVRSRGRRDGPDLGLRPPRHGADDVARC